MVMLMSTHASSQPMYRCTTINKTIAFQDHPCLSNAQTSSATIAINNIASPVRVRPHESLPEEHKKDFETLAINYFDTFWLMGRAQACGWKNTNRAKELVKQLEARHSNDTAMMKIAILGMGLGMKNTIPSDRVSAMTPLVTQPCLIIIGKAQDAQLPHVPAVLVLSDHSLMEKTLFEGTSKTGNYRIIEEKATLSEESSKFFISHRDKKSFISKDKMEYVGMIDNASLPLLIVAAKDTSERCPISKGYISFHTLSLPLTGEPIVTKLNTNCAKLEIVKAGNQPYLCFKFDEAVAKPSQIYAVDSSGKPILQGVTSLKGCPSFDKQGGQSKGVVDL